jgi:ATP-dependent Lhr-like helicase
MMKSFDHWFSQQGWTVFPFQQEAWTAFAEGKSGILNAPTGSGKTYALLLPAMKLAASLDEEGIKVLWITPLRALSREIYEAALRAQKNLDFKGKIAIRTGDTSASDRRKLKKTPPDILITTPESLHILLSAGDPLSSLGSLGALIADEWHELLGSKRGVQVQLAAAYLAARTSVQIWGISATIANLNEAMDALIGDLRPIKDQVLIRYDKRKDIEVHTVLPESVESFPWAGHLGLRMMDRILPILEKSKTSLVFTNTRSQCEIWYQRLLDERPEWAGIIAMHHGSISRELRDWVEGALHEEKLRVVVCTSSLDLGVDFRPVETIIQIGSPKGVARFLQRAGRSGHRPGETSIIHFVPTHSLEILEGAALRKSIEAGLMEEQLPHLLSYDVLLQYMMTLAAGPGFVPKELFSEVQSTFCYRDLRAEEFNQLLEFLKKGGPGLQAYEKYQKVGIDASGRVRVLNKHIGRRHRMEIGTIVGDHALTVKFSNGKKLGQIEEWFISQLEVGDVFWFAGRNLKLKGIRENTVTVKASKSKAGRVPSWMGGRMPLSSQLGAAIREQVDLVRAGDITDPEMEALIPLFELQDSRSHLPRSDEFLVEYFEDREGYHCVLYPFEGRMVHEGMGALLAYRLSRNQRISFSIAMNDYGLELLSDQAFEVTEARLREALSAEQLQEDISKSINEVEMARRKFRDVATISGLLFQGFPGQRKKDRHLQSSAGLLFDVFQSYEPDNLLFIQSFEEVKTFQLEENRLRMALNRIEKQKMHVKKPEKATPFAFPIIVDRLRERMSTEQLEDRIRKMKVRLLKT